MEADWRLTAAVASASAAVFPGAAAAMLSTEPSATKTGERRAKPLCKIFLLPNINLHPPKTPNYIPQTPLHPIRKPELNSPIHSKCSRPEPQGFLETQNEPLKTYNLFYSLVNM